MVKTLTPICNFNEDAPSFRLMGVDNKWYTLDDCRGENGLLVMFICNHCPFVKAITHKLIHDANALNSIGVGVVAIMSNNVNDYKEDSFINMQKVAKQFSFSFPYLLDDTQTVAKSYGAVCTPDFFGYNKDLKLQYRGRLDGSGMQRTEQTENTKSELLLGMQMVVKTGSGPQEQIPSIGCSIKWL